MLSVISEEFIFLRGDDILEQILEEVMIKVIFIRGQFIDFLESYASLYKGKVIKFYINLIGVRNCRFQSENVC